jgi:hypothetical protein
MRLVRQPDGSALCGQSCVAMLADVSLDEAIEAVGHEHGTRTSELRQALASLGVRTASRCRRISRACPAYPPTALLVARKNDFRRSHWMVMKDGVVYDPEGAWPRYDGWKITSYLEVYDRPTWATKA